ncbi:hypothetical protein JHK82_013153 [Glycine max]|nr:hypothetical protein JHK85_013522 [Glycine max]KAG5155184.1 hypothetical protein JHK82_013153 [Glycine max]
MAVAPGYSSQPVLQIQLCNQGQNQFQSAATTPTDFAAVNCWPMQNMQIQNTSSQSQTPANTTSHVLQHAMQEQQSSHSRPRAGNINIADIMAMHVLSQRWDVKWVAGKVLIIALLLPVTVSAKNTTSESNEITGVGTGYHAKVFYQHTWPSMKYGWKIIVGTIVGFLGSAFGNVGGVGGGGIFVPMLTLIIGFDAKSAIAISKCISVKSFFKGVDTWKQETLMMKEASKNSLTDGRGGSTYIGNPEDDAHYIKTIDPVKDNTNQSRKKVPIAVGMSSYQAMRLYKGQRIIASKGDQQTHWRVLQLIVFCACGILAGTIAGLLGLGGGFILAPLFLGLGIPPQVASATSILAMAFSASIAVVEYYLLKRFPISYALYFVAVATAAALVGQHLVRKVIAMLGRASVIIFILTLTLCVSAVLLGGVGVANMIKRIENKEYMGFGNLCTYKVKE